MVANSKCVNCSFLVLKEARWLHGTQIFYREMTFRAGEKPVKKCDIAQKLDDNILKLFFSGDM